MNIEVKINPEQPLVSIKELTRGSVFEYLRTTYLYLERKYGKTETNRDIVNLSLNLNDGGVTWLDDSLEDVKVKLIKRNAKITIE